MGRKDIFKVAEVLFHIYVLGLYKVILTFESADDQKGKIQFKLAPVFSSVRDKDKFPLILIRAVTQNITNPCTYNNYMLSTKRTSFLL